MVRIPGPGEIPNVRPARDPGVRNASANAFGRLEAAASAEQGRALAGLGNAVADYANALLESRQEAEDASFLAAYAASERVQASRALNKLTADEEGAAAGTAEQFIGTWNDGVDSRIDIVRRETGLTPSEGALDRARNISLALGGVFGARAVQNEHTARIALYGQTLDNGIEQLGSQVFDDPTQLDDVLIEADAMLTGAATFLPPDEVDRLRAEVPPRLLETHYRGRLAQGDAAGVLADVEQQQDDLPAAMVAELTRSAEQQLEIERHQAVVAAEADRIVAGARAADPSAKGATMAENRDATLAMFAKAWREVDALTDPKVRGDVRSEVSRAFQDEWRAAGERRAAAQQSVWDHVLAGGPAAFVPPSTLREAGAATAEGLRRFMRQGGSLRTDFVEFERLAGLPIEDLAMVNPLDYRGLLAQTEYAQLQEWVEDAGRLVEGLEPINTFQSRLTERDRISMAFDRLGWTKVTSRRWLGHSRSIIAQALRDEEERKGSRLTDDEESQVLSRVIAIVTGTAMNSAPATRANSQNTADSEALAQMDQDYQPVDRDEGSRRHRNGRPAGAE